jgi:hypothetical protein
MIAVILRIDYEIRQLQNAKVNRSKKND